MTQLTYQSPTPRLAARSKFRDLASQSGHYALAALLLLALGLLMLYPLALILGSSVTQNGRPSAFWIQTLLRNQSFLLHLGNSVALATVVTLVCNTIALPLATINHRYSFKGKGLLNALLLVPMVLPPFVGAIGMKQILGKFGSLTIALQGMGVLSPETGVNWLRNGGFWACAALISLGLYPIAYLNVQAALANIDPALQEAAENLGGKRFTVFRRITLPLAMPGIFAGSTIIWIWAFTELGTPLLLDYRPVVSRDIFDSLASASGGSWGEEAAKVVVVLAFSVAAYVVGKRILGRQAYAMTSKAAVAAVTKPLSFLASCAAALPFLLVISLAMLPHISVILYSFTAIALEPGTGWGQPGVFGWYRSIIPSRYTTAGYAAVFGTPEIYGSILNSLKYASVSTLLNLVLGIGVAWLIVRTKVIGRSALDALAMMPLAVPGLVMAMAYLTVSYKWPFYSGKPGEQAFLVVNPFLFLVVAYTVRRMPYLVRSAAGGLQQTSVTLEEAASNLGAPPWKVLWKVTLPLITANLIAGALLTFSFSMLEVSDSLVLAPLKRHYPITKMIYELAADTSAPDNVRNACALGVLAMLLLIVTMVTASLLMGKKLGAVFRA